MQYMSFFEKLKMNIAEDEAQAEQKPKKRGRPKGAAKKTENVSPPDDTESRPKKPSPRKWDEEQDQKFGELAIDVYETENELVVQAPVAGVKPEELDISVEDNMLVIRGERPPATTETLGQNFILRECYWGLFSRRLVLPVEVDGNKIKASLERGVLTIRMPKIESKGKKKIAVQEMEE
ncbi:MAG: hypothetical protein A3A32_00860 [Candidatus Wildermuthbacteria bacterium RIFCSPLOWO2_01_FULL_48_35]|uniref:SHSP domain-containing protein n=1 Tax=Candidatus Wildermuthbacteria bacterium RIFCSPLOWO2_01_FULL_48_35 TaxID=1802463 RepID=A0A1G2RQ46_9BACT|nr:MAG: hypothetical protein A3A32_00860 [Candidatus Wildermuthbacteria bacterium RIFCSPLOWO2_01_FULL_48_35]